ncbi:MAG: hypothetical protein ABEJ76_09290 [Halanaeroarchaeum sp.]
MAETHFQIHPEYTTDDGDFYAADAEGNFVVLDRGVRDDDRIDRRDLSDGTVVLTVPADLVPAVVLSETVDPGEIPLDAMDV